MINKYNSYAYVFYFSLHRNDTYRNHSSRRLSDDKQTVHFRRLEPSMDYPNHRSKRLYRQLRFQHRAHTSCQIELPNLAYNVRPLCIYFCIHYFQVQEVELAVEHLHFCFSIWNDPIQLKKANEIWSNTEFNIEYYSNYQQMDWILPNCDLAALC